MKIRMKKGIFVLLTLLGATSAYSAQNAEVIVDNAAVREYPQGTSKVIGTLGRGDQVAVSNFPTEGFYKVRISGGETGWISGNDILAGGAVKPEDGKTRMRKKPPQERPKEKKEIKSEDIDDSSNDDEDHTRILISYGVQSLSYAGLAENYEKTLTMNLGTNFGIEIQKALSSLLFLGIRAEIFQASTGDQTISTGATQVMKQYSIPIQLGFMFSPISSRFRLGIGAYGGVAVTSYTDITQTTTTSTGNIRYQTVQMVGTLAAQMAYKLGSHFGFFIEGDYHYEQTGLVPETTQFGDIPSFKIDYSGMVGKFGLEFCF